MKLNQKTNSSFFPHPLQDTDIYANLISYEDSLANNNFDLSVVKEIVKIYTVV